MAEPRPTGYNQWVLTQPLLPIGSDTNKQHKMEASGLPQTHTNIQKKKTPSIDQTHKHFKQWQCCSSAATTPNSTNNTIILASAVPSVASTPSVMAVTVGLLILSRRTASSSILSHLHIGLSSPCLLPGTEAGQGPLAPTSNTSGVQAPSVPSLMSHHLHRGLLLPSTSQIMRP